MADTLTNPMHVEVISPDGPIYREPGVEMVVARAERRFRLFIFTA